MSEHSTNRRKHVRRSIFIPCHLEGSSVDMLLTDLSEGGCFVSTTEEAAVGTRVTLHALFFGAEVSLPGRVVRIEAGRGFGFEIDVAALDADAREHLERFAGSRAVT